MAVIPDTNIVVKGFLDEEDSHSAKSLMYSPVQMIAPDLMLAEFFNAVWKKLRLGDITSAQAKKAIAEFRKELRGGLLELKSAPFELFLRAFEMAKILRHPVYDCIFLALAEVTGGVVVTADAQFFRRVRRSEWREFIRPLSDFA